MTEQQLQETLNWQLIRLAMRAKHVFIKLSEEYGLSPMQAYTLCSLEPDTGGTPMNTVSCLLLCDASNVTGIVDRMVANGHIERKECANDRRVKNIILTPKGVKLRNELLHRVATADAPIFDTLTPDETEHLRRLLAKTSTNAAHC